MNWGMEGKFYPLSEPQCPHTNHHLIANVPKKNLRHIGANFAISVSPRIGNGKPNGERFFYEKSSSNNHRCSVSDNGSSTTHNLYFYGFS
jgi:hypothetical protein